MYKKIYLEITNQCNLSCPFCIKHKRTPRYLTLQEFKSILVKIQKHTKFLYFHLLGEPFLHPLINEFIEEANHDFQVNITTNGYLLNNLHTNKIRQLNISLHSFDEKYGLSLENYINNIINKCEGLKNTYIAYRFWVNGINNQRILDIINEHYQSQIKLSEIKGSYCIKDKIYISTDEEFNWPDINNDLMIKQGFCQALKDHLGILVDGTVVPCCLDAKGDINLGNIFNEDLAEIILGERYQNLKKSIHNNKRDEVLCQNCSYKINNKI